MAEYLSQLQKLLSHQEIEVRKAAVISLSWFGLYAKDILVEIICNEENQELRKQAAKAIASMKTLSFPWIMELLTRDNDTKLIIRALEVIPEYHMHSSYCLEMAKPFLAKLVKHEKRVVSENASFVLNRVIDLTKPCPWF